MDGVCSSVEIEGGRVNAGFDMLLRPSSAPLRSATPTPLAERARLCCEMFSICIRAGEILRSGAIPSPRTVFSKVDDRSVASADINYMRGDVRNNGQLTISQSQIGRPR